MKRKTTLYTAGLLLLALLMINLTLSSALAQEGDFTDTFDGQETSGWEYSVGTQLSEGNLVIPPHNFAARFGAWSGMSLDLRLMVTGPGEFIVNYSFTDQSRYSLHFAPNEVWLERSKGDSTANLAFTPTDLLSAGNWTDLRVAVADGRHEISLDGSLILEATDPDPLPAGGFLLQAEGERTATIDSMQVSAGATSLPAPGLENPAEEPLPEAQVPAPAGPEPGNQGPPNQGNGTLDDLLAAFLDRGASQVDLGTFVGNLLLAALSSFILSRVYIHWGSSLSNRRKFAANFILITITTTFIILVVRSSVALSLGLVGALSIVRFRTAIKEPEELAYLFFAIGLGIGLGDNQRMITLVALAVGIILIGLMRIFRRSHADVNLHLTITDHNPDKLTFDQIIETVETHCAKWKLIRFDEGREVLEAAFLVEFEDIADLSRAKAAFSASTDSLEITFLDNRGVE